MLRIFSLILILAGFSHPVFAEATVVSYVKEAEDDPSFAECRVKLLLAIHARDTEAVIGLSDPEIHLSFGGQAGHDDFREILNVPEENLSEDFKPQAQAMRDEIWESLESTIKLGGRFDADGGFTAPYYWNVDLPDSFDAYSTYFVTGSRVALRDGPSRNSNILARVSYAVVDVPYSENPSEWRLITIPGTKYAGYMHEDYLRSQIDYRAAFEKVNGEWKMQFFIAGD